MVNPNLPFDMTFVIKCQIGPHIITSSQAAVINAFLSSVNLTPLIIGIEIQNSKRNEIDENQGCHISLDRLLSVEMNLIIKNTLGTVTKKTKKATKK